MFDQRIAVMQVISGLSFGGAERMAVNVANTLPRNRFSVHLCSTRSEGPLSDQISHDVGRLKLFRKDRLSDIRAVFTLVRYIRKHKIRIIHCHATTVFLCSVASCVCPSVSLIWHDHHGGAKIRPRWLFRIGTKRAKAIIACKDELATWARVALGFSEERVFFVRNFVTTVTSIAAPNLPPTTGARIVCVANITPQKDIINLVRAISLVVRAESKVQVLLVGAQPDSDYVAIVKESISEHGLEDCIVFLGVRSDVPDILASCDIGVLSSESEGLPLALIEYGMASLVSVATDVGQCADVLGNGRNGIVVPPKDPQSLAKAIVRLLRSPDERKNLGRRFRRVIAEMYGPDRNIKRIVEIYDAVIK